MDFLDTLTMVREIDEEATSLAALRRLLDAAKKAAIDLLRHYPEHRALAAAAAANATNDFERFGNNLLEWLCRALAGLVMGVAAGYASHLLLDMGSKRGLPLFA